MYKTLTEIKKANKTSGGHFFDDDKMASDKIYGNIIHSEIYHGRYFLMSYPSGENNRIHNRTFQIYACNQDGRIDTSFHTLDGYPSKEEAIKVIDELHQAYIMSKDYALQERIFSRLFFYGCTFDRLWELLYTELNAVNVTPSGLKKWLDKQIESELVVNKGGTFTLKEGTELYYHATRTAFSVPERYKYIERNIQDFRQQSYLHHLTTSYTYFLQTQEVHQEWHSMLIECCNVVRLVIESEIIDPYTLGDDDDLWQVATNVRTEISKKLYQYMESMNNKGESERAHFMGTLGMLIDTMY